uniref:LPPA601 n=1 Tax=Homo sapiens TaxID=9606 RepID=Q6UWQ9_HUMAN|nr:LPPA601 [Homo sapiens]
MLPPALPPALVFTVAWSLLAERVSWVRDAEDAHRLQPFVTERTLGKVQRWSGVHTQTGGRAGGGQFCCAWLDSKRVLASPGWGAANSIKNQRVWAPATESSAQLLCCWPVGVARGGALCQ